MQKIHKNEQITFSMNLRSRFTFGLRLKGALWSTLLMGVVGACGVWLVDRTLTNSFQALEQEALHADVLRLANAVEQQLGTLNEVAREWSYWDEMARYTQTRNPVFAAENFAPAELKTSNLVGLAVFDRSGKAISLSSSDSAAGVLFDNITQAQSPTLQTLLQAGQKDAPRCGLAQEGRVRLMLCKHPVNTSTASGPTLGTVLIARVFDAASMDLLRQASRLNIDISELPTPSPASTPLTLEDRLGASAHAQIEQRTPEWVTASLTLRDVLGQDMVNLKLNWPRQITQRSHVYLAEIKIQLLLIILMGILAMVAAINYVLIHPLQQLRDQIRDISDSQSWQKRIQSRSTDEIAEVAHSTNQMLEVIEQQVMTLHEMSLADALTGLPNRRAFDLRLKTAVSGFKRHKRPVALLLLDLDNFKKYNDTQGHLEGDLILKAFAETLRQSLRRMTDLPARYGGEEFVVLLEDTTQADAQLCAESILSTLRQRHLRHPGNAPSHIVTCSAGLAMGREHDTPQTLLLRADTALYAAKRLGRDRLVVDTDVDLDPPAKT